jgi:tRNA-dihydrouridine synthase
LRVAVEHSEVFEKLLPEQKFFVMRKHLVGYCSGFPEATELRKLLVQTNSALEVEEAIKTWMALKL